MHVTASVKFSKILFVWVCPWLVQQEVAGSRNLGPDKNSLYVQTQA